jgi:AraC-like DNA-binding protein
MNVLNSVLGKVKLSSTVYFKSDFSSPWGMNIPKTNFAQFHIITKGQCVLKIEGKIITLFTGDIIVLPFGTSHKMADEEMSECRSGEEVLQSILNGTPMFNGEHVSTNLICGHFEFDKSISHLFFEELPKVIHITGFERKERIWLENITNLVIHEMDKEQNGNNIIANKLGEVFFIHVLRTFIEKKPLDKGFIAALQDKRMNEVLKAIHQYPEKDWKVELLAQKAGMSRASFSNKFKVIIGKTPMGYLTSWRVTLAKELLRESNKSVGEISHMVGYQSEAAFNRVFKSRVEKSPLRYRRSILE